MVKRWGWNEILLCGLGCSCNLWTFYFGKWSGIDLTASSMEKFPSDFTPSKRLDESCRFLSKADTSRLSALKKAENRRMVEENWWWSGVKEARGNLQDISYIGHRCYQNLKEDPSMTLSLKSFKMDRWT